MTDDLKFKRDSVNDQVSVTGYDSRNYEVVIDTTLACDGE